MCGLFDRFLATTWVNVFVYRKRDSNMFKLVSPCFMLQVSSYPWIRWSICNTHATPMHSKRSYSLPSPAPVLTLQVAPEKQLKHVTPTKSTFQDTFQVGSVTNIFLPFTLNALSIRIQNCVEGVCRKCKPFKTIQNLHLLHFSSSFYSNCNQNMTKSWTKSISPLHCQCSHWHGWNWSGLWFWKWCLTPNKHDASAIRVHSFACARHSQDTTETTENQKHRQSCLGII